MTYINWALSSSPTSHLVLASEGEHQIILDAVTTLLADTFDIHHTTVQIEHEKCAVTDAVDHFSGSHAHDADKSQE